MRRVLPVLAVLLVMVVAACGGGNGDSPGGENRQITNPATVPSAEPIEEDGAIVYRITDNGISAPSGASTPVANGDGNGGGTGGGGGYTIVSGDTCSSIAAEFDVTSQEIIDANAGINEGCTNLQPGQQITIPGAPGGSDDDDGGDDGDDNGGAQPDPTQTPGGQTWEVEQGDTCSDIAAGHGVSVDALQAANPDLDCGNLQIGTVVLIP